MKKIKLLIPTLSALAVVPAIVGCSKDTSVEEKIIDAIIAPTKLTDTKQVTDIVEEFYKLSDADKQKEVIYDIFGICNLVDEGQITFENNKSLTKMWSENIVSFKTNVTKCSLSVSSSNDRTVKASFLGYISFVFNNDVKGALKTGGTEINFRPNDYIMYTYDFVDANVTIDATTGSMSYAPKIASSVMGFRKIRCNAGADEFMLDIANPSTAGSGWTAKNSHRWVQQ